MDVLVVLFSGLTALFTGMAVYTKWKSSSPYFELIETRNIFFYQDEKYRLVSVEIHSKLDKLIVEKIVTKDVTCFYYLQSQTQNLAHRPAEFLDGTRDCTGDLIRRNSIHKINFLVRDLESITLKTTNVSKFKPISRYILEISRS